MSRRKQAKPRACLKLGEKEDDENCREICNVEDLLEPKEEMLSADESDDDIDDDEDNALGEEKQQQQHKQQQKQENGKDMKLMPKPHESQPQSWRTADDDDAVTAPGADAGTGTGACAAAVADTTAAVKEDGDEEVQHPGDKEVACTTAQTAPAANGHCKSLSVGDVGVAGNEPGYSMGDDEDDDQEDDFLLNLSDNDEEDELQSLDSFYSDMYSTHTSSSYSPSISDGTLTPNSHHHLPASVPSGLPDDHQNEIKAHGEGKDLQQHSQSFKPKRPSHFHHHHHHHYHHQQALKIANKLRKINKESNKMGSGTGTGTGTGTGMGTGTGTGTTTGAEDGGTGTGAASADGTTKFDKLTGEGIKSRGDGSYQCQFCDKSFPRLGYLKHHVQSHAEHLPFKCEYCAKLFKHKRSRDRHKKLHTNERNYKCPHCEAAFSRSDHLKIHMKTHDIQKPFQCSMCNRGYNTAAALTSHMQKHKKNAAILAAGGNPNALNYSPRSTGSASVSSSNSSLHKRRYALALANNDSGSRSRSPSRLDYPKRSRINPNHSTPTPMLRCSYCPKVTEFSSLEQLNAHLQNVHEQQQHQHQHQHQQQDYQQQQQQQLTETESFELNCEYCTMKFGSIAGLFQHMRSTHLDRLSSPPATIASYYEHFNRLEAPKQIKQDLSSPQRKVEEPEELPTDLSSNKRQIEEPTPTPTPSSGPVPAPGVFFCNQCNAGLPDFESFRNHLKTHIAEGMQLICPHCGLTLPEQQEYERHVVAHFLITNSEFNCSSCGKTFAKSEDLQQHLLAEHVVTMMKCALCSELCDNRMAMQLHLACTHSQETKLLRCSACMELFRSDAEFHVHVKTRHQLALGNQSGGVVGSLASGISPANALQCMFCRAVCSSELEMHFHLAAHARQFRCPSCPETFHVEFLLDRHMQSQHGGVKETKEQTSPNMGSLYVNALLPPLAAAAAAAAVTNNNNSIIDYNVAFKFKGLFGGGGGPPSAAAAKFYSPLQVDTKAQQASPHPALMYGLSQRYLMEMYKAKSISPAPPPTTEPPPGSATTQPPTTFSCGMCERQDLRSEAELHSHRKLAHNLKTGVSLRCAYCAGNFKSRAELEQHMKSCHNSTGKHKCLICDEIFPSPAILAEHKLQHSKVGQSGKCSHCSHQLEDVAAFRNHLSEHGSDGSLPLACICCRQTLHSEFELCLHAKFHTKSSVGTSRGSLQEPVCALCLEPLPAVGPTIDGPTPAKLCEKCLRKHNLNGKRNKLTETPSVNVASGTATVPPSHPPFLENRCNLCKMILPHAQKLQEHLVEHTFAGTEQRGFNCYICSAVFTAPAGLLNHMSVEHGAHSRPYDCNLCPEKFYFRAELEHHQRGHELRPLTATRPSLTKQEPHCTPISPTLSPTAVKQEIYESETQASLGQDVDDNGEDASTNDAQEEEEYIEVEQMPHETRSEELMERSSNSS